MIGHEDVGMQPAFRLAQRFAQPVQVARIVFLGEEAGFAVVAALHDVQRYTIEVDAGAAGHAIMLARK